MQAPTARHVCEHLLTDLLAGNERPFWRRFTGQGDEFVWICESCGRSEAGDPVSPVCVDCADRLEREGGVINSRGLPETRERRTDLQFRSSPLLPSGTLTEPVVAAVVACAFDEPRWILLLVTGELLRLSGLDGSLTRAGAIEEPIVPEVSLRSWLSGELTPEEAANLTPRVAEADERWKPLAAADGDRARAKGLSLVESSQETIEAVAAYHDLRSRAKNDSGVVLRTDPAGRFAAVCTAKGPRRGLVLDLDSGQVTMRLDHRSAHEEHSRFPVVFFDDGGRPLLVHATNWNRLDISDPATGELLTSREPTRSRQGELRPPHYLDYFHAGLSVSPDQRFVAEDGWVWHPFGVVRSWDLARWLHENPWEGEDGPSIRSLCWREYFWDAPMCWLDEQTLAVYGFGEDVDWIIPAVRVFDVTTGEELRWFPGPTGRIESDGTYLFSWDESGISVWDPIAGERLHHDSKLHPMAFHRSSSSFLVLGSDGSASMSQIAV
jgi:hypothetical protein